MTNIDPTSTDADTLTPSIPTWNNGDIVNESIGSVKNGEQQRLHDTLTKTSVEYDSSVKQVSQQHQQLVNKPMKKFHHITVCLVPPESNTNVWDAITKIRTLFKDPGLYRWPPHVNLLYPFIDVEPQQQQQQQAQDVEDIIRSNDRNNESRTTYNNNTQLVDSSIIDGLLNACRQIEPFYIKLQKFGTFGNKKRGVLWLYPDSYYDYDNMNIDQTNETDTSINTSSSVSPLISLQNLLVQAFPYCNDQNLKSNDGFNPHMTISHFIHHDDALDAQQRVQDIWPTLNQIENCNGNTNTDTLQFKVEYIYLLQRSGDSGQFLRVADIPLGSSSTTSRASTDSNIDYKGQQKNHAIVHPTPIPFIHMPTSEADWVYDERMKLKQRRNGQWRSRGNNRNKIDYSNINSVVATTNSVVNGVCTNHSSTIPR